MVATNNSSSNNGDEKARGLKKGPWSAQEDAILKEYVRKHGEGNWNAVQRNCGLLRCGKSCRLRWANHLRPNLKKGSFSIAEERLIIELHAKMGNKWARMASQLPGRTDNEIKNYWNTRVKRLQRAGLPIYPENVPYNYQNNHLNQQTNFNYAISPPSYPSQFNTSISFLNPTLSFRTMQNPPIFFHPNPRVMGNHPTPLNNLVAPFTSPQLNLYGQSLCMSAPFGTFGLLNDPGNMELAAYIPTQATSLNPSLPASSSTTGCGGYGVTIGVDGEGYRFNNDASEEGNNNSGLLETVLEESTAMAKAKSMNKVNSSGAGKGKEITSENESSNGGPDSSPFQSCSVFFDVNSRGAGKGKEIITEDDGSNGGPTSSTFQSTCVFVDVNSFGAGKGKEVVRENEGSNGRPNSSIFQSSCMFYDVNSFNVGKGKEIISENEGSNGGPNSTIFHSSSVEEVHHIDDDLSDLLDCFPSSSSSHAPMWYDATVAATLDTDMEQNSRLEIEGTTSDNPEWTIGSYCWSDMDGIC